MKKIAFVSVRKNGQNFGKPISVSKILDEFSIAEISEQNNNDNARFYDENGDPIESTSAIALLSEHKAYAEFEACTSKLELEKFISKYPESKIVKLAKEKIEEIILNAATTEDDYKRFLSRFPNSKFVPIARGKLPNGNKKRITVISSSKNIDLNDFVIKSLEGQGQTNVTSSILDKTNINLLVAHIIENDLILAIVDDEQYVELFVLFAICLKYNKQVHPVYPHDKTLKKITNSELTIELIKEQSQSIDMSYTEILREIRLDLNSYFKKMGGFKSIKSNQMENISSILNIS